MIQIPKISRPLFNAAGARRPNNPTCAAAQTASAETTVDDMPFDPGPAPEAVADSASRPARKVLLCTTLRWPFAARLAMAFESMGCHVEAYCPHQHALESTTAVKRIHRHSVFRPQAALRAAIAAAAPDLIVPCDDELALQLARLHQWAQLHHAEQLESVIAVSLGSPQACNLAANRGETVALAAALGVLTPPTATVACEQDLKAWLQTQEFPAVLKADRSYGGQGVVVVRNLREALQALRCLSTRPSMRRGLLRLLLDRDWTTLLKWWHWKSAAVITVQQYIAGRPANRAVACDAGRVLAGISVEALQTQRATGPASVIRRVHNPAMEQAASRMAAALNLSGLWGFDFIIDGKSGDSYLIEANPRATPVCHLSFGPGQDLPAALLQLIGRTAVPESRPALGNELVALFPDEWQRNHRSTYLGLAFHDVPWSQPDLVRDCMDHPWSERGLAARIWRWLKRHYQPRFRARHSEQARAQPRPRPMSPLGAISNRSQPDTYPNSDHE